jgi:hypothetical protein
MHPKFVSQEPQMTAATASNLVRQMIQSEARGPGDSEGAMARLEQRYGIGFWTLDRLRRGRAKTCEASIYQRIRMAYLDLCARQLTKLEHQIAIEQAAGDDTLEDLEGEARDLAARIAAKKAALR